MALSLQAGESPKGDPHGQQFVAGISPYLDRANKDAVFRTIVRLLVEDLPLDSTLTVYDAFQLQSIAQVTIPNVRAFTSPKTRANQFAGAIQSVKLFLAQEHPRPTNAHLKFEDAIRLPQFLDFLTESLPGTNAPIALLLIGSPLYQDPKEPAFSMVDGYFPSDGHLQASRDKTVFGSAPRNGVRPLDVHWVYFGDPWISDLHKEKVTRFWSLYLGQRSGQLLTFSGDLPTAQERFCHDMPGSAGLSRRWTLDPAQSKVEMLRITRDIDVADWITRDTLPETAQPPPHVLVGKMKIGIRWKNSIDLDLYAAPFHGAETLYFEHPRSPEGYYFKDHRSSPGREYEFVEFDTPVDARKVEASVNFYEGSSPGGSEGEVRIEFDGRIYSASFSIRASAGNRGRAGRTQAEFWTRIPVQDILKIAALAAPAG
jgi:hypothetical protein